MRTITVRHRAETEAEGSLCDDGSELHSENLSFGDLLCLRCLLLVLDLRPLFMAGILNCVSWRNQSCVTEA